jgi:NADPH:quinone reductase-like Zn-dependent oxidoreductase
MGRNLRALALSPIVRHRLTMVVAKHRHADLERLAQLVEAGELTPTVEQTYPLPQAPDAMRQLEAGRARGKLVITLTDGN